MEANLHVCVVVNIGTKNWRKCIFSKFEPVRGLGLRFFPSSNSEFMLKVKFVWCDIEQSGGDVEAEGVHAGTWAECNLPKRVTADQLAAAGFEEFNH